MKQTNTIGIDLAKNVFHLCTQDTTGHNLSKTKLGRNQLKNYLATTAVSKIVFESCATAHYWSRIAEAHGHEVKLIHPAFVKPYLKSNKNDFNDAEAICEAASRPTMRYVAAKTSNNRIFNCCIEFVKDRFNNGLHWLIKSAGSCSNTVSPFLRA